MFNSSLVQQHSFVELNHEIFSMAIPSLSLIQEGHLSVHVPGKRMCTSTGNHLEY